MMIAVVAGHDQDVAAWVGDQLGGRRFQEPYTAFGFLTGDLLTSGSVFNDYYRGGNIEWTHAGCLRPGMLRFLCRFVFNELQASRVTATTRRGNNAVSRMLERAMQFEGVRRQYFGPDKADDALVYVLFRAHADRWLQ